MISKLTPWAALVAAIVSLTAHASAQTEERAPVATHHVDYGLVSAGITVFSIACGLGTLGAFGALDNHTPGADPMIGLGSELTQTLGWGGAYAVSLVPIAGPIVSGAIALDEPMPNLVLGTLAFVGAAAQTLGLALLIAGLAGVDDPVPELADGVRVLPIAAADRVSLLVRIEL